MLYTVKDHKTLEKAVIENPWRNAYWFARMLISGDKYGGIGKDSKLLSEICLGLRKVLEDKKQPESIRLSLCKNVIHRLFETRFSRATGRSNRIKLLIEDLSAKFNDIEDVVVFILTAENIMIPINESLKGIPNDDKKFTEALARSYLDKLGDHALVTVVNFWDDAGVAGCLTAERVAVVREFTRLRRDVEKMGEYETNLILTAFVQEFERRLGQKRKGRAGGSLEDVATFLFDYYQIEAENKPEHFQADIEVDKWVRTRDKWLIGISCKRTLRERWKQVSSATPDILGKFKIKQIWHLTTYDEDLSDEKLTLLGGQRHIFYLRDESRRLEYAQKHIGMRDYVRPMSKFITDLKREKGT